MVERKMEKSMEEMDLEYIANSDLEWSKYKNKTIFVTGATGLIGSKPLRITIVCIREI
mgnify:CR=1 FL=1